MKLILFLISLASCGFTSCTSKQVSPRGWATMVETAEKAAYSTYMDIYQADETLLLKYKLKF